MKWIGTLVVVGVLCAACGSSGSSKTASVSPTVTPTATVAPRSSPTTLTVTPILTLKQGSAYYPNFKTGPGTKCRGVGGYSDLRRGRAVTIYDQRGSNVVGTGFIKQGFVVGKSCYLGATVKGLPRLPFYKVQFANRNKVPFSAHDLIHHTSVITIG